MGDADGRGWRTRIGADLRARRGEVGVTAKIRGVPAATILFRFFLVAALSEGYLVSEKGCNSPVLPGSLWVRFGFRIVVYP
jgi:hypothetical protein